jgi:hypothetical protein
MASCKTANALYRLVPVGIIRRVLIHAHMEHCPHCQARLISRSEAAGLFVRPENAGGTDELWRRLAARSEVESPGGLRPLQSRPRWAVFAAASVLLVFAAASFWLMRGVRTAETRAALAPPTATFEIDYVRVGGAPAQAYVYQPRESDMIIVWVEKNPKIKGEVSP